MRKTNFDSSMLKSILHNLMVLESQNIETLKGYRLGARIAKICLFQISVCEENKMILKNLYNIENV